MLKVHPQYITDPNGKKLSVILTINEFNTLIEELEELDDIRLFDEAKEDKEPSVPIEEAFKLIESKRNLK